MPCVRVTDTEFIESRLEQDRRWAAYALGDLDEPFCRHASWYCAPDDSALTLLYREFATALLFCTDASPRLGEVLDEVDRGLGTVDLHVSCRPELAPLVRSRYPVSHERSLLRMALDTDRFSQAARDILGGSGIGGINDHEDHTVRLGRRQLDDVAALFRESPPEFFLSWMLDEGVYCGIYQGEELAAVAGTHMVSSRRRVACLGNIYTRPDQRARGLATRATCAVAGALVRMGIDDIVLTVVEGNDAALRVYQRLGFQIHCRYVELFASLKREAAAPPPSAPG